MDNKLEYKNYYTKIYFSTTNKFLYGRLEDISDDIEFKATSVDGIIKEFHNAVDDYISSTANFETAFISLNDLKYVKASYRAGAGIHYKININYNCKNLDEILYKVLDTLSIYTYGSMIRFNKNEDEITMALYIKKHFDDVRYSECRITCSQNMHTKLTADSIEKVIKEISQKNKSICYTYIEDPNTDFETLRYINLSPIKNGTVIFNDLSIEFYSTKDITDDTSYMSFWLIDNDLEYNRLKLLLVENQIEFIEK